MTENKREIQYLDMGLMERMCHKLAVAIFDTKEDPIAQFYEHEIDKLDSALNLPKAGMGNKEFYPTLVDKATILYYTLNKNHPFKNGNKRISATSLLVFLLINEKWLKVSNEELYEKTLSIAKSDRTEKDEIVEDIKRWISSNLISLPDFIEKNK
jgi:death-on-curing protein